MAEAAVEDEEAVNEEEEGEEAGDAPTEEVDEYMTRGDEANEKTNALSRGEEGVPRE